MGSYGVLEPLGSVINVILMAVEPHQEDWQIRFRVIDELRNVVESVQSLRGATVEEYGSFVSNLFTKWGDLDISIQLPNGLYISDAGKKRKVALLRDLMKALQKRGVCRRLQFISHARVPILKFESKLSDISCDISIDSLPGRMKSKFFLWIDKIDERFRMMVLLVKEWAKSHNINDPKTGSFNSFSLTLLVIFHFQTCVPSILPPLRDIYPGDMIGDLKGLRKEAEQHIAQVCLENISRFQSSRSKPANRSSLAELFISFLGKFAQLDLKAGELGICPYTGQWEELEHNKRWMPKTYALFIEDPFEQPQNSARTVNTRQLGRISEVFQMTHQRLLSSNQDRLHFLGPFARSQLFQHVTHPLATNPSYDTTPFAPPMPRVIRNALVQTQSNGGVHYFNARPRWDTQPGVAHRPPEHVTRPPVTNPSYHTTPFAPPVPRVIPNAPVQTQCDVGLHYSNARPWWDTQPGVAHRPLVTNPSYNTTPFPPPMPRVIQNALVRTQRNGGVHYSNARPRWDAQPGVAHRPNDVHATQPYWRARPECLNAPLYNVRPQPNVPNHHPQAQLHQNKLPPLQQAWKPRVVRD